MTRKKTTKKTPVRKSAYRKDFEEIVGPEMYQSWMETLKMLGPNVRFIR